MKKILVLMTGGTIGSYVCDGTVYVRENSCRAIEVYRERFDDSAEFDIRSLMNILSENLDKHHWETIINFLLCADLNAYSGVIVTHGSDTLSYSSAMLGLCLDGLDIPVVLTAAGLVPDDPGSNAADNIHGAVTVIKALGRGVYTVYENPGDAYCTVYRASDIVEADRVRGCFSSFDGVPLGRVEGDTLVFMSGKDDEISHTTAPHGNTNGSTNGLKDRIEVKAPLSLKNDVLMIRQYPGMDISNYRIGENVRAVLVVTYHSASACTQGRGSILALLDDCKKRGTELYLASFEEGASVYETSDVLIAGGAIPLFHISNEAAYARLLLKVNS